MGKQHNSFKKDMDLLSEAYGTMLGGAHAFQGGGIAQQAANHMRDEDGEDHNKTGDMSDAELLKKCCEPDGSLKPAARDALAKLYGHEDNEDTDEADAGPEAFRRKSEDATAEREGFDGPVATPAH
jgi:hypothetical protein|tara:strand:- start:415 stop:792 length:378 start_codon:yes stop_codon:yes gene_type:complete